ncbi:MAG: hypothetical protein H7844_08095 [Nitrospirae bacterium YQR-1]
MNNDLSVFNDLIVNNILVQFGMKNGKLFAVLKESGTETKLKKVEISDIPENSVLIKLDGYEEPKTLFKSNKGQLKRCDYVLLTRVGNQGIMLFIEMKSQRFSDKDIEKQFKGALCVMDYCNAVLNRFHNKEDILSLFEKRFIVFYTLPIPKRPTRPAKSVNLPVNPPVRHNKPESPLKIANPYNPFFKSLI